MKSLHATACLYKVLLALPPSDRNFSLKLCPQLGCEIGKGSRKLYQSKCRSHNPIQLPRTLCAFPSYTVGPQYTAAASSAHKCVNATRRLALQSHLCDCSERCLHFDDSSRLCVQSQGSWSLNPFNFSEPWPRSKVVSQPLVQTLQELHRF